MAQPQPQQQYSMPPRPYSPPQSATSPGTPQQFALPPNKRQRLSPNPPSQPGSPYVQSPYSISPGASAPPSTGASPVFGGNIQIPPNAYTTPYGANGQTNSNLNLPQTQTQPQPNHQTPQQYQSPLGHSSQNQLGQQGNYNNYAMPPQGSGTMGPPSKPADKSREDVDVMDVLGGTGVDLREEEQYTFQMYNNSFNSQISGSQSGTISSGHSFTQFPPAEGSSVFGSGAANAPAEANHTKSQDEYHQKAADKAWHDAAHNLATSRQRELNNPFLEVGRLHSKMAKVARDNGLALNTDAKGLMGTMRLPESFPQRDIRVQTAIGPDGAMTVTNGNFLSNDTQLVDQLALLSIASKHRLRVLLEDATKLARGRQTGSHGIVPEDWADAAAQSNIATASLVVDGAPRGGWKSAVSPHSNPLKRSFSSANKTATGKLQATNEVVAALRISAVKERDLEEIRLKKRLARASGEGTPRQGSVIPGTPGSVAPDPTEKAPTKKEQKKKLESKANEAASHAAANVTTAQFLGGGSGMFGKKKRYSWMTGGGGGTGSGASTPGRINTQGLPTTPGGPVQPAAPERLTVESARRLGMWREDKEKGVGIQIRDWITVLEEDGHEKKPLQKAYLFLDQSEPK